MELLVVEGNPTDRVLIRARLRRAFPSARISAVAGALELNEYLAHGRADIVITDYWLGWSDGLSVLQRVRERWPGSRVIMLTGNGGEEVVASAFKHGLFRYLLKPDGFDEVAAAAGEAMESKRREEFHELMAMVVGSIPEGIFVVDAGGIIVAANPAARRIYGYKGIEMEGRAAESLAPKEWREEIRRLCERAIGGGIVPRFPTLQVRGDGGEIAVEMRIIPIRDGGGAISGAACITTQAS